MAAEEPGAGVAQVVEVAPTRRRTGRRFAQERPLTLVDRIVAATAHLGILLSLPGLIAALVSLGGSLNSNSTTSGVGLVGLFGSLLGLFIVLIAGAAFAIGSALIGALAAFVGYTFHYPFVNRKRKEHH